MSSADTGAELGLRNGRKMDTGFARRQREQFQAVLDKALAKHRLSNDQASLAVFSQPPMTKVSDLEEVIKRKNDHFGEFRSKHGRIYSALATTLTPIEVVGEIIAGAAEEAFAPSQHIFSAVMYFVTAARGVSEAYDSIVSLLEQLSFFTRRLKLYFNEELEPDTISLLSDILAVLFEVIVISTSAITRGRAHAFIKNLFGGDDAIHDAVARLETLFGAERGQIIAEILSHMSQLEDTIRDGFKGTQDALERVQMNQGRLIEDMSRLEQSMQTLKHDDSLHGDKLRAILKPSPYPEDLYFRFHSSMAKGTGSWVMREPVLGSWMYSEWPFLLIYGAAGVGKTYVSTFLITDLAKRFAEWGGDGGHNSLAYFFFRNDNPETRSVHQALCDMASQLADDDVYYSKYLLKTVSSPEDIKTIPSAFRRLVLEPVLNDTRQRKVFLIFEGLDEAPWEEVEELLYSMKNLQSESGGNVQVLFTGRPELQEPIAQALDDGEGVGDILHYLHVTPSKNSADVRSFIEQSISRARNLRRAPAKDRRTLVQAISKKADGVFIMAALLCADVTNPHLRDWKSIVNSLKEYPSSVSDMLLQVVKSMAKVLPEEQCGELSELLAWISLAVETLTLGQVEAILTLKLGIAPWEGSLEASLRGVYASFFTLDREDGRTTADLLERREREFPKRDASPGGSPKPDDLNFSSNPDQTDVVFFHASLGDFFRSDVSTHITVGKKQIGFDENTALIHVAKTCLRLFAEPEVCTEDTARLQIYAAKHWQEHICKANLKEARAADKTILIRLVHRMLTHEATVFNWTDFNDYKNFIRSHAALLSIQELLADMSAISNLDQSIDAGAIAWAKAGANDLYAIVAPLGKIFARAWLHKDSGISRQGVHKSTTVCSDLVQHVAFLKKGYKWRGEEDDSKLTLEDKINAALGWAEQDRNWWWHLRVGSTWMTQENYSKALAHYDEARKVGGDIISTSAQIAVVLQRQGKYEEALELYLLCEKEEEKLLESGQVTGQIEHLNQTWRLYKDQIQAAECLSLLYRVDEAAEYYRRAIKNSYDKTIFEAETAYIALMIKHNRFRGITQVLQQMDRPDSGDPQNVRTRLVRFLIAKSTESVILEWVPRIACRKDVIPFAKDQYKLARQEAKKIEDTAAEYALQLGRGIFHIYAKDYSHALRDLETLCINNYRPRGSIPIRSIQTQALRRLAYLYKQIALHTEDYGTKNAGGQWKGRLENLERRLCENQNLDIPLQFVGQSHNDATMYRGLLLRKAGDSSAARKIFQPLVKEALNILDDDEPQNDTYALDNLAKVLLGAGEIEDATALHQSMRPPASTIVASAVSEGKDELVAEESGRKEPMLPGIVTSTPFCMQCLDTLDDAQPVAVCQYCLDPFCLMCLAIIKGLEIKKWEDLLGKTNSIVGRQAGSARKIQPMILESSCRKDHDWVTVEPLGERLAPGQILVRGKIVSIKNWKKALRDKWGVGLA